MYNDSLEKDDLQLVLAFTNAYERLHARGEISEEQFSQVLDIIENYQKYSESDARKKLKRIFSSN